MTRRNLGPRTSALVGHLFTNAVVFLCGGIFFQNIRLIIPSAGLGYQPSWFALAASVAYAAYHVNRTRP
jgi:hypothetical protein